MTGKERTVERLAKELSEKAVPGGEWVWTEEAKAEYKRQLAERKARAREAAAGTLAQMERVVAARCKSR